MLTVARGITCFIGAKTTANDLEITINRAPRGKPLVIVNNVFIFTAKPNSIIEANVCLAVVFIFHGVMFTSKRNACSRNNCAFLFLADLKSQI